MKGKIILLLLLFSLSFYGQNDTISVGKGSNVSVISADKVNIVYRGLPNPISIAVPNCKSFEATGIGLSKVDGKYQINPGPGLESILTLDILFNDNTKKTEIHKFRIKNIPRLSGAINGFICRQSIILMSKKELKNAIISIDFNENFLYDLKLDLKQFVVRIKKKAFVVEGSRFSNKVLKEINKLPINSVFDISEFSTGLISSGCCIAINPIKIMIVEDNHYQVEE